MASSTGKLAGRTEWAARRRPATRRAGFNATAPVQIAHERARQYALSSGQILQVDFLLPEIAADEWEGFGGWFKASADIEVDLNWPGKHVLTEYAWPNWNKVGALYEGAHAETRTVLTFTARRAGSVALFRMGSGRVQHDYLDSAKPALRTNMWSFAPEANFYVKNQRALVRIRGNGFMQKQRADVVVKSCNRCGRFLPINVTDERAHLSFSNHCVADHRRPCRHTGFGKITDVDSGDSVQLEYGFQLECRFCKKFEVNAAHNPQRTAGQMKEDAARRRHFELLLEHLYGGSPQLRYKNETGHDLASDVFNRFGGRCFKCGYQFASEKEMHLDHTRPLALLWPLDGTATALCSTHNSEKRDRPPAEFYTDDELVRLAQITGVSPDELRDPCPNLEAISLLGVDLNWFHDEFLTLPALQQERDGKLTADLVVKALEKVLARVPGGAPFGV